MEESNLPYVEDFEFTLLDGSKKRMSDYKGSYILIDFFGVTCQPCQYQMLVLTEIFETYKDSNLEMISIDVWISPPSSETPEDIENLISSAREYGVYLNWTFGYDDQLGTLQKKYAKSGVPSIYLLDKNGNVYYSHVGYTEYIPLTEKIDELLNSGG
jgi:thiol-disulfide isomerase/thioredoxin